MHKQQIIQHTLSSYYAVPICLYNKNALEKIYQYFQTLSSEFHSNLKGFLSKYPELHAYKDTYINDIGTFSEMIDGIQEMLLHREGSNFSTFAKALYDGEEAKDTNVFSNDILDKINTLTWKTKPSYVLPLIKGLKSIDSLWGALVLANIKLVLKNTIDFDPCFIGVEMATAPLDTALYIHIGRYLKLEKEKEFKYHTSIQKITQKLGIESNRVTELLHLAKYREALSPQRVETITTEVRKIFLLTNIILKTDITLTRDDIELIVFFAIAIAIARTPEDKKYLLQDLNLCIQDHCYIVKYNNNILSIEEKNITPRNGDIFDHSSQTLTDEEIETTKLEFRRIKRRFIQNSKLREFEYKEMLQVSSDKSTQDILRKICNTVLAKHATLLKYDVREDNFTFIATHGERLVDKKSLDMARSVVNCHYTTKESKPYIRNDIENTISLPVIYKGKLLAVLLLHAEPRGNFNAHIINILHSLSSILGQHIYKEIFNKHYFKIFNSFADYRHDEFSTTLHAIAMGLQEIFFCYGISLWRQNEDKYENIVNTLSKRKSSKIASIDIKANSVVAYVIKNTKNKMFSIDNIKTYNDRKEKYEPELNYLANTLDDNINSLRMYAIVDKEKELFATMTLYNRSHEEFNLIEEEQMEIILTSLKTFFSISNRIKKEGKLITEYTLHDTSQHLLHIDTKAREITNAIDEYDYAIPYAYRYRAKLKDIQNHTRHIDQAFGYLAGKSAEFKPKKDIDAELDFMKFEIESTKNPNTLVQEVLLEIRHAKKSTIRHKGLKLDIEDMKRLSLKIPRRILVSMLSNLFFNAIKYSYPKSTIKVWGEWSESRSTFSFFIQNVGIEIKEEEVYEIFDYERRGVKAVNYTSQNKNDKEKNDNKEAISPTENRGIGLFLVNELIQEFGGSLTLEKHEGHSKYPNINRNKKQHRFTTIFKLTFSKKYILKDKK